MVDGCFLATQLSLDRRAINHLFFYSTDIIQQVSKLIGLKCVYSIVGSMTLIIDIAMAVGIA